VQRLVEQPFEALANATAQRLAEGLLQVATAVNPRVAPSAELCLFRVVLTVIDDLALQDSILFLESPHTPV
jgi:hypothetical protein